MNGCPKDERHSMVSFRNNDPIIFSGRINRCQNSFNRCAQAIVPAVVRAGDRQEDNVRFQVFSHLSRNIGEMKDLVAGLALVYRFSGMGPVKNDTMSDPLTNLVFEQRTDIAE
jgi:hypothetical protein